jgi:hypothetical protein
VRGGGGGTHLEDLHVLDAWLPAAPQIDRDPFVDDGAELVKRQARER